MPLFSYAQNFEDVLLWRALKGVENGFYIDIGAQDPVVDSVSLMFYEQGWRGIHVEPSLQYYDMLRAARPDETVLNVACSDKPGMIDFYAFRDTGMSTASKDAADVVENHGWTPIKTSTAAVTLDEILDRVDQPEIHWMKIDVEGFEEQVLRGWRKSKRRPWIIVVEAIAPLTHEPTHDSWDALLVDKGYVFTYFDKLNRYYVSKAHLELQGPLSHGPWVWDEFEVPEGRRSQTIVGHYKAELSSARQAQADATAVAATHAAEAATHAARADELTTALSQANGELAETREQLNAWRGELDRAWSALGQTQSATAQMRNDLDRMAGDLTEARGALTGAHDERDEALRRLVEARHAGDLLQVELDQAQIALTEAQGRIDEAREMARLAVDERDRTSRRLVETERDLAATAAQLAETRRQLDRAGKDLRDMAVDMAQARASARQLTIEFQDQRDLLAARQERALAAQAEAIETLSGLNNANAEIARLRALVDESIREQERLSTTLRKVLGSRWWRATAPFRGASDVTLSTVPLPPARAAGSIDELLAYDGEALLRRAYLTFLGREPEPEGLAAHLTQLRKAGRERMLYAIATSEEGRRFGASVPGLDTLVARFAASSPQTTTSLSAMLSLHDEAFVRNAYAVLLGRAPEPAGLHGHVAHLRAGTSRFAILAHMRLSPEGRSRPASVSGLDTALRSYRRRQKPGIGHALRWAGKGLERARLRRKLSMIETRLDLLEREELTAALFPRSAPAAANDVAPAPLADQTAAAPVAPSGPPVRPFEPGRIAAFSLPPSSTAPLDWRIEDDPTMTPEPLVPAQALGQALTRIGHRLAPAAANATVARRISGRPPKALRVAGGGLLTGFDWGETGLPSGWAEQLNTQFGGVACASLHARKILIDNGVTTPIVATGLGVDHWDEQAAAPDYRAPGKAFKFLHVSDCGPEDGVDLLLESFGRLFDHEDDVSLIIVPTRPEDEELGRRLEQLRKINPRFPDVAVEYALDDARLKALYQQSDAFLAPSRAAGFNLPLALALVSGKPVVTTAWGGHLDYCSDANAWLVDFTFQRARTDHGLAASVWAEPVAGLFDEQIMAVYRASSAELAARTGRGRRDLLTHFTWAKVAARLAGLAHEVEAAGAAKPVRRRVGWITTWKVRCGIAGHIANMLGAISPDDVVIFASDDADVLGPDEPNCLRLWSQGKGENDLHRILPELKARSIDSVVIQFNYGFFNHAELDRFIDAAVKQGVRVLIDFHSTIDPKDVDNYRLTDFIGGLRRCHRILAHGPNDMNRLKAAGLVDNVMLFPLGVVRQPAQPRERAADSTPLISSFGFAFPNKGMVELVEAVGLLKRRGLRLRVRMLNSEHFNATSGETIRATRAAIQRLGLQDDIELRTEYLDEDVCLTLLGEADLVVNPYQVTGESASAAVRYGITSGAPVTVTPLAIFDDLGDAVFRMPGLTPEDIAQGIADALRDIQEGSPTARSVREAARRWIDAHDVAQQGVRLMRMARAA